MSDRWPRLSIVTPSFNQAAYLERTIESVLSQGYPNLEYIIIDGGSKDGSADIIRKYEKHLAYWVSEKDQGQTHAINKGFARATGEIYGWQNSDDTYAPGAFFAAAKAFGERPQVDLVFGNMCVIDAQDQLIRMQRYTRFSRLSLLYEGMVLHNTSAFWRASLHQKLGGLDPSFWFSMDYDFFVRASFEGKFHYLPVHLGNFRWYPQTKSAHHAQTVGLEEMWRVRRRHLRWYRGGPASKAAFRALRLCARAARGVTWLATHRRLFSPSVGI